MKPVRWITKTGLLLLNEQSSFEHGGVSGLRDEGLLESALARPKNLLAYQEDSSIAQLAAAYAYGLAKNHPFVDGNKRAAFAALGLFLAKNDWLLNAPEAEATLTIFKLAAGDLDESELADWIGAHLEPRV